jgi:streptogramin lyase
MLTLAIPPSAAAGQLIQQGAKLTASEEMGNEFGGKVALSADGETALIGSTELTYVFTRSGETWTQQATLPAGTSLALSGDGSTALIGGTYETYVFTRSGSNWTRQATLSAGPNVAVSENGNTAVLGDPATNEDAGAAWVYVRSGETWNRTAELTSGEAGEASLFGYSVAVSGDGSTALVGGPGAHNVWGRRGAGWVFARSGESWSQQGTPLRAVAGEESEPGIGTSVALSGDGDTALVGGEVPDPGENIDCGRREGAAWVYQRSGSTWAQPGTELRGHASSGQVCGGVNESVALSGDGSTALIGGEVNYGLGAAWLFTYSGSTWNQTGTELQGSGEIDTFQGLFGASVALSSTADTALIADPHDSGRLGAAWAFAPSPAVTSLNADAGPAVGGIPVTITGSNFTGVTAVTFGSANATSFTVNSESSITTMAPPGTGTVDVSVTTAEGTSPSVPADRFSYGPAVTAVSPDSGALAGGTSVTITGAGLRGATAVRFGSVSARSFTVNSESSITAVAPSGTGTVDVSVTTPQGLTAASSADRFLYVNITSFSTGAGSGALGQIIAGPDGDLWFIDGGAIGSITPQGEPRILRAFEGETFRCPPSNVTSITPGPSANLAFLNDFGNICEVTPDAEVTYVTRPFLAEALTLGPNGTIWYSNNEGPPSGSAYIESIRDEGFRTPETLDSAIRLFVAGTNNDLWFYWSDEGVIRATATGAVRQYPVGPGVAGMTAGPGDDLWFTNPEASEIGRVTPEGGVTRFFQGITGKPKAITAGQEGDIWFTEPAAHEIGRITPEGVVTQFGEGIGSAPVGIAVGPEGDVWFTEESGEVGRLTTLPSQPTIASVSPDAGRVEGGATVTINGTELAEATEVRFGTADATSFKINSASSITAEAPKGVQGTVDVTVTNSVGTSAISAADQFTYVEPGPAPTVTKLSAKKGPAAGGTPVSITGTGFVGVTTVKFGSTNAGSFTVSEPKCSPGHLCEESISTATPAGTTGTVEVDVTTPNGESGITSKDHFAYEAPTVTDVSPNNGSKAGGAPVTITGSGFALGGETTFEFGKGVALVVNCSSTSECTMHTPAAAKTGTVDVRAEAGGKTGKKNPPADHYTYD